MLLKKKKNEKKFIRRSESNGPLRRNAKPRVSFESLLFNLATVTHQSVRLLDTTKTKLQYYRTFFLSLRVFDGGVLLLSEKDSCSTMAT